MSTVQQEFSKNAHHYNRYNMIQKAVVAELIRSIPERPRHLLDIGCGRGEVYAQLGWEVESFLGVDFSPGMCALHPTAPGVRVEHGDFNDAELFERLAQEPLDRIISASALQWSSDLEWTMGRIAALNRPVSLALFTSKTFASLHDRLGIQSPLYSADFITDVSGRFFDAVPVVRHYRLDFESTKDLLHYIKRSGVSSGSKQLSVGALRDLVRENILRSIEAEVVFICN